MRRAARRARAGLAAAICAAAVAGLALAPAQAGAVAAPGDLDRSFGDGGVIDLTSPPSPGGRGPVPVDLAVGPADEIFLVSEQSFACEDDDASFCSRAYVTKLGPNGVPDTTFAAPTEGVAEAPSSDVDDIAVDRLGRPTLVMDGDDSTVLARLLPDGRADRSFGDDGVVSIDGEIDVADTALAADGSIILAGIVRSRDRLASNLAFVRLGPHGFPDPAFGVDGVVGVDLSFADRAGGVALVGEEIFVTATSNDACCSIGEPAFRLLRFSKFGQLLQAWDPWPSGKRRAGWFTGPDALVGSSDGGLHVLGDERRRLYGGPGGGMAILALDKNRNRDREFGTQGSAFAPGFLRGGVDDAAFDLGNRLVVGGTVPAVDMYGNEIEWLAVTRRRPNGRLDRTFGGGNLLSIASPPGSEGRLRGMAVQSNRGIVLLGLSSVSCFRICPQIVNTYTLARFIGGTSRIQCRGRRATVVGTRRSERIVGTSHRDVIAGLGGRDRVVGRGGSDLICGGLGNDLLIGGRGNDNLLGGRGGDRLFGRVGNDRLHGGAAHDLLVGGPGRDRGRGGPGRDRVRP